MRANIAWLSFLCSTEFWTKRTEVVEKVHFDVKCNVQFKVIKPVIIIVNEHVFSIHSIFCLCLNKKWNHHRSKKFYVWFVVRNILFEGSNFSFNKFSCFCTFFLIVDISKHHNSSKWCNNDWKNNWFRFMCKVLNFFIRTSYKRYSCNKLNIESKVLSLLWKCRYHFIIKPQETGFLSC